MIISEKQIIDLIWIAQYVKLRWSLEDNEIHMFSSKILDEITNQQSEELRDIK